MTLSIYILVGLLLCVFVLLLWCDDPSCGSVGINDDFLFYNHYDFRGKPKVSPIRTWSEERLQEYKSTMSVFCAQNPIVRDETPVIAHHRSLRTDKLIASGLPFPRDMVCDQLLVVMHPDDDAIFAGNALSCTALLDPKHCWKVVSVSDGGRQHPNIDWRRVSEFVHHSQYVCAEYELWSSMDDDDINDLLKERDWKVILTHGPAGEYGNSAHAELYQRVHRLISPRLASRLYTMDPRPDMAIPPSPLKIVGFREYDSERAALVTLFWWTENYTRYQNNTRGFSIGQNNWCEHRSLYVDGQGVTHTHMMWPVCT